MWIKKLQINKGARLNHPVQSSGEINPKHVQSDIGETFWNLKLTVYILMTFRFKVSNICVMCPIFVITGFLFKHGTLRDLTFLILCIQMFFFYPLSFTGRITQMPDN